MKRRDMKLLLEERFERIALLETRIDTMDQLVEGYRAREQSIFDTLSAAKENAANAEGWKREPPRRPRRPRRSPTRIEPFVENGRYRSIS